MKATFCFSLIVAFALSIPGGMGCGKREATTAEVFDKVGGVDKVNQEARGMFDRFGTITNQTVYAPDRKDFPAISALADAVMISGEDSNNPAQISIRYGGHFHTKFIYIYDQNEAAKLTNELSWPQKNRSTLTQFSPNIFADQ